MLSGIGPKENLIENNIADSPMVGQNLKNHSFVPIFMYADVPEELTEGDKAFNAINYIYNREVSLSYGDLISDAVALYSTEANPTRAICHKPYIDYLKKYNDI